ncbi:MAG: sulfotransferase [Methanolobus sp.]
MINTISITNLIPLLTIAKRPVFQDAPFSCPDTFKYLDKTYPGSKFILTMRNDSEQWYQSLIRFHTRMFGEGNAFQHQKTLKMQIMYEKILYNMLKLYNTPDSDPYNKETLIAHYEKHNREVLQYFKDRPEDLLVLNIAKADDYNRFVEFIGVESPYSEFPWENKT